MNSPNNILLNSPIKILHKSKLFRTSLTFGRCPGILNLLIHFGEIYNVEPFPCLPGVNSHLHGSVSAMGLAKRKSWSCLKGFERFEIHNFAKKKAK